MTLRTLSHFKILSYNKNGAYAGFLLPICNICDIFFKEGFETQQINIIALAPGIIKGPHLHQIRSVLFTCLQGNIRVVTKAKNNYSSYYSGELFSNLTIEIPAGTPAAIQNIGDKEALILALWNRPWTPDLKDEYEVDYKDFDFGTNINPESTFNQADS